MNRPGFLEYVGRSHARRVTVGEWTLDRVQPRWLTFRKKDGTVRLRWDETRASSIDINGDADDATADRFRKWFSNIVSNATRQAADPLSGVSVARDINTVIVHFSAPCSFNCVFCQKPYKGDEFKNFEQIDIIQTKLRHARSLGPNKVLLSADEPLGHPEFKSIVRMTLKLGFETVDVLTTGAPLVDRSLRDWAARSPIDVFHIPIYGHADQTHLAITGGVVKASEIRHIIETLSESGKRVTVVTIALRRNLAELRRMAEWCQTRGLNLSMKQCLPVRKCDRPYADLAPAFSEIAAAVKGGNVLPSSFPPCIEALLTNFSARPTNVRSRAALAPDVYDLAARKTRLCRLCPFARDCDGVFERYLSAYGPPLREIAEFLARFRLNQSRKKIERLLSRGA
jgi:pyruvate-formate lyase-activating enzyme